MFVQPPLPPREWLHSKECLAAAIISAVQNFRDDLSTAHDFRLNAQDNAFLNAADDYLAEGLQTCVCHKSCPHGNGPWECTEGSESSREKYCDECLADRISAAVDAGDFDTADKWGYELWSRMSDRDLLTQLEMSRAAGHAREVATCLRIAEERCL